MCATSTQRCCISCRETSALVWLFLLVDRSGEDPSDAPQTSTSTSPSPPDLKLLHAEPHWRCLREWLQCYILDSAFILDCPHAEDALKPDLQTCMHTTASWCNVYVIYNRLTHGEIKAYKSRSPLGYNPPTHFASGDHTWVKHRGRSSGLIMLFIRLESCSRHRASRESLHEDKRQCLQIQCKQGCRKYSLWVRERATKQTSSVRATKSQPSAQTKRRGETGQHRNYLKLWKCNCMCKKRT